MLKNSLKTSGETLRQKRAATALISGLLLLALLPLHAAPQPPKVGLVLSGGGAKGLVHIGVIKVLEEAGIKVDLISGNSMGSIIGAMYAAGYSGSQMEKIITSRNWPRLLGDKIRHRQLSVLEKKREGKYLLQLQLNSGNLLLPKGLRHGQNITSLLSKLTAHLHHITNFNRLPIPFRCIAVDIRSGTEVVLSNGFLPLALRSSMSIPSMFTPIRHGKKLLVDGGLLNNFPVDQAVKMGADLIIGVDVSPRPGKLNEQTSMANIMNQTMNILRNKDMQKNRDRCDLLILPDVRGFSSASFTRAAQLIRIGEKAARSKLPEIKKLAARLQKLNHKGITPANPPSFNRNLHIAALKLTGLVNNSRAMVINTVNMLIPGRYSIADIQTGVNRLYGTRFFRRVIWRLHPKGDNSYQLELIFEEAPRQAVELGINYDTHYEQGLLVGASFRNLLGSGSRFFFEGRLNKAPRLELNYTISTAGGFGVKADIWLEQTDVDTWIDEVLTARYRYLNIGSRLGMILQLGNYGLFSLGAGRELTDIETKIAPTSPLNENADFTLAYAKLEINTWNRTTYPTKGVNLLLHSQLISDWLAFNPTDNFTHIWRHFGKLDWRIRLHPRITLMQGVFIGMIAGKNAPFDYYFYLGEQNSSWQGRLIPFLGQEYMAQAGRNTIGIRSGIQLEPVNNLIVQLRYETGKVTQQRSDLFNTDNLLHGIGVTVGWNLLYFPVEGTVSVATDSWDPIFHMHVGYRF